MTKAQRYTWGDLFGIARSLLIYYGLPWRQSRLRRFYAQFVKAGDLCFDIGAHVGNRTRALAALGANVVAIEPQPKMMALLRRFFGGHEHITLVEAAAGAEEGEGEMLLSRGTPTVASLSKGWVERVRNAKGFERVDWDGRTRVRVTSLDALIAAYGLPAFCKIDVEGYEAEVLRGLSEPLPALSFEYIPAMPEQAKDCVRILGALGVYEYSATVAEGTRFVSPAWFDEEGVLGFLDDLSPSSRSGDIYARLIAGS